MSTVEFNMNNTVVVTLTEFGAQVMNARYVGLKKYGVAREFVGGQEYKTQLWSLMQDFGEHIHLGMPVPFDGNNIKLVMS